MKGPLDDGSLGMSQTPVKKYPMTIILRGTLRRSSKNLLEKYIVE